MTALVKRPYFAEHSRETIDALLVAASHMAAYYFVQLYRQAGAEVATPGDAEGGAGQ
ncbi:hypothetical protein [Dietzia lutea]|uniref:hypothetical protein n=1 Tax=Dietzia lutea TaxID=546160 RepID=UPI00132F9794|nr:hypothetical protein [Dietzia lutea]